jgi:hypothetical protein
VQVGHADKAREVTGEVGGQKDRPLVVAQAGEYVMAVLPDGLDDHKRGLGGNAGKDVHAPALVVDEAMALRRVHAVRTLDLPAKLVEGCGELALDLLLHVPGLHVGGQAKVAARHGVDRLRFSGWLCGNFGHEVSAHK